MKLALAKDYRHHKSKVVFDGSWMISRKYDGVRCTASIGPNSESAFFSRSNKSFRTLGKLKKEVKKLGLKNIILDGEICSSKDEDDFQSIMKGIRRTDGQLDNFRFMVFDVLTIDEYVTCSGGVPIVDRLNRLYINSPIIKKVEQVPLVSSEQLVYFNDMKFEGAVLRNNSVGYEGKRTSNLLKIVKQYTAEYVVTGININGDTGDVASLTFLHKGHTVSVSSGLTHVQRGLYAEKPELILGKVITVGFAKETKNEKGGISLRFPVLKAIFGEERDV